MPIPDTIGASFAPTREQAAAVRTRANPLQQAIQVLSLRLPQNLQGAPAPAELLNAPAGRGADIASAVVQSVLRTVLGGQGPDVPTARPQIPASRPAPPTGAPAVPEVRPPAPVPEPIVRPIEFGGLPPIRRPTLVGAPPPLIPRQPQSEMASLIELLSNIGLGGGPGGAGGGRESPIGGPRVEFVDLSPDLALPDIL